jgi:F-box protein 11
MTEQDPKPSTGDPDQFSFDDDSITFEPSSQRRSRRKYVLIAVVLVISFASFLILIRGLLVPQVRGSAAADERSAPAGTLVVSQTGQAQYSSIKAAVADASPGATILVRAGTYREAIVIDKDVKLIGDKGAAIECAEDGCLRITAPKATIRNFTINAKVGFLFRLLRSRQRTTAVMILNGRTVIEDCDVTSNNGTGILVSGTGSAPEIRNVRVHDCFLNGILFTNKSTGLVENSNGYKNRWAAIRADEGSSPIIRRSRIHSGKMDGILIDLGGTATVEECEIFENNFSGVQVRKGSSVSLRQTKLFRNFDSGVDIHHGSYGEAESCDVFKNKDSGIKVSHESGSRILNTRVYHQEIAGIVVWHNSTTEIEGATIYENATGLWVESGGQPVVRKSIFRSNTYSAVDVKNGGNPLIEQSQIYDGKSSGIYFHDGGHGVINECTVFGNANSNIVIASGSNPEIRKTSLSDSRYAGVLVMDGGQGSIIDCQIFNNYLGVEIRTNSTVSVADCSIKNNRHQGLVIDATSEASIIGSTLTGNADGPWKIAAGAQITRERNTE